MNNIILYVLVACESMSACLYKFSYRNIHPNIIFNSLAGTALNLRLLMQLGSVGVGWVARLKQT